MSIEKDIERIANALEILAKIAEGATTEPSNVIPAKKSTKKGKKDEEQPPAGDQPNEDQLRLIFQEYVGKKGNEEGTAKLKELIGGYGAAKIGEVKPKDYAAIIKEVKSWD